MWLQLLKTYEMMLHFWQRMKVCEALLISFILVLTLPAAWPLARRSVRWTLFYR